jgi:hypothetical protein
LRRICLVLPKVEKRTEAEQAEEAIEKRNLVAENAKVRNASTRRFRVRGQVNGGKVAVDCDDNKMAS